MATLNKNTNEVEAKNPHAMWLFEEASEAQATVTIE